MHENAWQPPESDGQGPVITDPYLICFDSKVYNLRYAEPDNFTAEAFRRYLDIGNTALMVSITAHSVAAGKPVVDVGIWSYSESRARAAFTCTYVPLKGYYCSTGFGRFFPAYTDDLRLALISLCKRGGLIPVLTESQLSIWEHYLRYQKWEIRAKLRRFRRKFF